MNNVEFNTVAWKKKKKKEKEIEKKKSPDTRAFRRK
jgi:hypothetical protein